MTPPRSARTTRGLRKDPGDPLLNRSIQQVYPPGSLFKVVVSAAALSSGEYTPDTEIPAPAVLDLPETSATISNYDDAPCLGGEVTLTEALAISCNTAFARIGLDLGDDALRDQAEKFGFNERTRHPADRGTQHLPRRPQRPPDGSERHRPVRRPGDGAADGDGRGRGGQ